MSSGRKGNINITITRHYGLIILLTGSIGGLAGMSYWLDQVWINEAEFRWITFVGITFASILLAAIGYILIRIGYDNDKD